jgi:hypothetical protein
MLAMTRTIQLTALGITLLVLNACGSMKVYSYTEHGASLIQYATYDWGPLDQRATGDPRLDNNPFFQERIQAQGDRELTRRGYVKATTTQPDLTVVYRTRIRQEVDLNSADRPDAYTYCAEGASEPYVYDTGTLLIDLVDARTKQVVWRGWAEGSIEGVVNNQPWMEKKIDEVVARIFEDCPRRP